MELESFSDPFDCFSVWDKELAVTDAGRAARDRLVRICNARWRWIHAIVRGHRTKNTGLRDSKEGEKYQKVNPDMDLLKKMFDEFQFSNKPQGPSDGDKTKNTGNDASVGCLNIGGHVAIENSNGTVAFGNTNVVDLSGISEAVLSGISEAVSAIGKQILKVVENGVHQILTLTSKLLSSSLGIRRLKRCINKIK